METSQIHPHDIHEMKINYYYVASHEEQLFVWAKPQEIQISKFIENVNILFSFLEGRALISL
jgi:hypothetical protein